jgi:hypothetical protein
VFYSNNGCTGNTQIDWFINDSLVLTNSNTISVDLNNETDNINLRAEANFTNVNSTNGININIRKISKDFQVEIINPTCSNSADGIISFDPNIISLTSLKHNGSDISFEPKYDNGLYLDSLEAGTYIVSYDVLYDVPYGVLICDFSDTITLENILDFTVSDTVIDLAFYSGSLTIKNSSNTTGDFLWQIDGASFIRNDKEFSFPHYFYCPGNYEIKLTKNNGICNDTIVKNIIVEGTTSETTPPNIAIDETQIEANYKILNGNKFFDGYSHPIRNDTLEIYLSCLYKFPDDYYFNIDNATITDDCGIISKSIVENSKIDDDKGYGTLTQTITAVGNSGYTSTLVIITTIGDIYAFNFNYMSVGGDTVKVNKEGILSQTDFEFCNDQNIEVEVFYSMNTCTGIPLINWFKNDSPVPTNPENIFSNPNVISIDLSNKNDNVKLSLEALFDNTNFHDRFNINIRKISKDFQIEIIDPTCLNSSDGSIALDPEVSNVNWGQSTSNDESLNSLNAGSYYVSYNYEGCEFNDTITLVPENILDFDVSDSVINLSQNELLTISNHSNNIGEYLWQIGDSTFINNSSEIDYAFKNAGNYEIKLTDNSNNCNDALSRNIIVDGIRVEDDTIPPTITITESQIIENYFKDGAGFDGNFRFLNSKTLEITLSCIYSFPDDYYFKIENATIKDDIGIAKLTIVIDDLTFDGKGYGTVVQTITAVDSSGNTSKFVVKTKYSGSEYLFNVFGIDVGGNVETNNDFPFKLEKTDFEFCNLQSVDVVLLYSKNGCTSDARVDWYINNERVKINADKISVDLSSERDGFKLEAEGKYSNTNFQDRIRIDIKGRTLDFAVSDTIIDLNQKDKLTITNLSKNIGESLWQIGDTTFVNNENEFEYVFKSPGKFNIKLTDVGGFCNDPKIKNIRVEKSTLVLENSIPLVKIGPNPFTNFLNIDMEKSSDYDITIFGIDGRVCYKNRFFDMVNNKLNLSFLTPGIYVLNINSTKNSEPVKDFKIVKLTED